MQNAWVFCPNLTVVQQLWSITNNITVLKQQSLILNQNESFDVVFNADLIGAAGARI